LSAWEGERRRREEDRRQRAEIGGLKIEVGNQKLENGRQSMQINSAKELEVYKKGYRLAMRVFELSRKFPAEEKYALTSQIRRSSRSICLNLREAWAKRRYEAHFISKLTDCDGENAETDSSLDFATDCGYITTEQHAELTDLSRETGKMLGSMLKNPKPSLITDH
jgi:four helix bundle protein